MRPGPITKSPKFPSKTFLLGEYSVLRGGKALILASPPFFSASYREATDSQCPFPAQSAAGIYWSKHKDFFRRHHVEFSDPHQGRGGFGASGAEFLSLFHLREGPRDPWEAHKTYKQLANTETVSGADILAQKSIRGESGLVFLHLEKNVLETLPLPRHGSLVLTLFHTGKKLSTHAQQVEMEQIPLGVLNALTEEALAAWKKGDSALFATKAGAFGKVLEELGLLNPHSAALVRSLYGEMGALGAKGCGALGADVVLSFTREPVPAAWAEQKKISKIFETRI